MEYTISALAKLSGVSSRTLRYYDQIKLLQPQRTNSAGYRIYGRQEVDRLQQILYFKSFGLSLETIRGILDEPQASIQTVLLQHYQQLLQERAALDSLLTTLAQTIDYYEGEKTMTDQEKFRYFKEQKIRENEANYGAELREAYGEEIIEQSNQKWQQMTQVDYQALTDNENRLLQLIKELLNEKEGKRIPSDKAEKAFAAHQAWLKQAAPFYSAEYHRSLGDMYVQDERFTAYYDQKAGVGSAQLLKQIIDHYTKSH